MAELILALDVPHRAAALRLLDRLPDVRWVKVGPVLMTREGPELVRELVERPLHVFLDLKWHDIPNTVAEAVSGARELGISMATVHVAGGDAMMRAAAVTAGDRLALVGVTVLTSHDAASYGRAVGRDDVDLDREVVRLAEESTRAGLSGVVCSPREIGLVRRVLGQGGRIVVPGIRRSTDALGGQTRVASAAEAVAAGATHLVIGRPVVHSADPAAAFGEFLEEAQCAGS